MLIQVSRFTSDGAGLEKTLRLLQSLFQITAAYSLSPAPWLQARAQLALARRYFRILKWIDCFANSFRAFREVGGVRGVLEVGRWMCLGMYFALEAGTILNAMGVHKSSWAADVFLEANEFWFYGICVSLVLGVMELWDVGIAPAIIKGGEREKVDGKNAERVWKDNRGKVMKRLLIDSCDLLIPGSTTGWIAVSSANVGMASVVSTVLASTDIWERVQNAP